MANRISKNHHYLPQCYLKGFTHNGKQLFIYDKKKDEIRPGNIENSFTLWKRNVITWPSGETNDWLENMYSVIESQSAYLFPKIIDSSPKEQAYDQQDKLMMSLFISVLFWRIPGMDNSVQKIISKTGLKNRKFHLEYPNSWTEKDKDRIESLILAEPGFQKVFPLLLALEPFQHKNFSVFLETWAFYYQDPGLVFTADIPYISREEGSPKDMMNEFILPLSPGRILIASRKHDRQLDPEWNKLVNLQLIHQAERYVCSNNEHLLRDMVDLYKIGSLLGKYNDLKESIFDYVE